MSENSNTFGKEVGLLHEVMITGRKVGADHLFWSRLAHNRLLFERFVQFTNQNKGVGYTVEVDYNASPDQLIEAGGYTEIRFILNGSYKFPVTKTGKHTVVIELWDEPTLEGNYDDKERLLDELGYRHADIVELLTLVVHHPAVVDENYMIKALGSQSKQTYGHACAWVGNDNFSGKQGRYLGVSFEKKLSHGTYAVIKKTADVVEVVSEPYMLAFKNPQK